MPNVMAALPNIGGALCSTPQSLADAHYYRVGKNRGHLEFFKWLSQKLTDFSIFFGTVNPEETSQQRLQIYPPHLQNVATVPCSVKPTLCMWLKTGPSRFTANTLKTP